VDDCDGPDDVGVGVDVTRLAMGRSSGVADAWAALEARGHARAQARDPALGLVHAKAPRSAHHGEPGGVVPAVFELGQSLQQDGHTVPASYMRNDPAHVLLPSLGRGQRLRSVRLAIDNAAELPQ